MAMSQLYQQHLILSEIKPKISAEEIFILRTEERRVSRVRERRGDHGWGRGRGLGEGGGALIY